MTYLAVPPNIELPVIDTLGMIPRRNAQRFPDRPVYAKRSGTDWVAVLAGQFAAEVDAVARGLVARGIAPGQPVAILSPTSYEWNLLDFALWRVGAFAVPIYDTSSSEQIEWILSDSSSVAIVAATSKLATLATEAMVDPLPVWVIEDDLIAALVREGADVELAELDRRTSATRPEDTATIVYTSGTTGRPKGCVLAHATLIFVIRTLVASTQPIVTEPGARTVMFLPLAHVLGRGAALYCAEGGMQVAFCPTPRQLVEDLGTFRPTFLVGVPRIFERVFNAAQQKAHAAGKGRIFDRAAEVAVEYSRAKAAGGPSTWLRVQHAVFDRLVYSKIRHVLGGRLSFAITGGASLGERLGLFFAGVGVNVMEGYGLTESTASGTFNRAEAARIGSVGQPMPGTELQVAQDGEILLRGPYLMSGYHNNPAATREVIDAEGWLHTGDIGRLDQDGFLTITGRKKEIIVTSGGKNVAPVVLEDRIQANVLISHAVVVGEGRPFVGVLITLDPDALAAFAKDRKLSGTSVAELKTDPQVCAEIQRAIDWANSAVSRAESIRAYRVLDLQFTEEAGFVTPSQKLKRSVITQNFAAEIDSLYQN